MYVMYVCMYVCMYVLALSQKGDPVDVLKVLKIVEVKRGSEDAPYYIVDFG